MKVKEINLTANLVWSPKEVPTSYLACGTSTQQIDTSAGGTNLQIYNLNLGEENLDTKLVSSVSTPARFHQLTWSGVNEGKSLIAGGCDNNAIYVYDSNKLIQGQDAVIVTMKEKHCGPVYSLDFNCFQKKLLASGSNDSEILIWDITKPEAPMTPGTKSNVAAKVTCVSWNRQVEHILASTYGDRCVVYDLRKSSSIVHISESVSRIRPYSLVWHPTMATQLILSSDNDQTPIAQVWDLRYSTTPMKTMSGHQRGIISTAWCTEDSDIFITSGKDNRILVWNPSHDKTSEIIGEFPSYNQFSYDLAISPKDPSLVATASIDGTVSVYSLLGGGLPPTQTDKFSAIADSFPGMEIPSAMPQTAEAQPIHLKAAPKWLHKPAGARFVFGGRIISWNKNSRSVELSQVTTEPELVQRSEVLETALAQQDMGLYCSDKAQNLPNTNDQTLWQFISATFNSEGLRDHYMHLLGYSKDQVARKVRPQDTGPSPEELAAKMATLSNNEGSSSSLDPSEQFEMIASAHSLDKTPEHEPQVLDSDTTTSTPVLLGVTENTQGLIRHALLVGDFESAIELCLQEGNHSHALMLAIHSGGEIYYKTRDKILSLENSNEISSLVGALVQHDLTSMVATCALNSWKEALVALLTYATEEEFPALAEMLGSRLEAENDKSHLHHAMICYICAGALNNFVSCWIKTQPDIDSCSANLQDLVEIVMVLQKALQSVGKQVNLSEDTVVSQHMCKYASLLAAQGALHTAASYLTTATQGEMLSLKDRVYKSLGYQTSHPQAQAVVQGRTRTMSVASDVSQMSRRASTPRTFQPPQFTPSVQAQQANLIPPSSPMPPFGGFNSPVHQQTYGQPSPIQQHQVQGFQPAHSPYGAPQPVSSQPPPMMQPMAPAPNNVPPPMATAPPTGGLPSGGMRRAAGNRYVSETPATNSLPGMFNPSQPPQSSIPSFNPPQASIRPFDPSIAQSPNPNNIQSPQPMIPQSNMPPPNVIDPQMQQSQQYSNAPSMTPAALDRNVPRGWNDPPALSTTKKNKQQIDQSKPMQPVQPIMNPVAGAPSQPTQFQGFQGFQSGGFPPPTNTQSMQAPPSQPPPMSAPPVVEKACIPTEHQVIQEVLDGIRTKGLLTVQNMMAKQRLENLGPKIEVLYDKLRAGQVKQSTLNGLHDIVGAVGVGDYHRALQIHTATVASGNFSEMSQYMPPLKMLLTTCMQFQVFLQ